ncbi:MAG: DUF2256 domain-containing protein [Pegethrix bostrychoides GSE-TBD4-15B]|uniref:DUF2256 domain-containing protein n=1 Tax=Pegethrix bostrychoides GSE-TBD4-15B TaxID=2839662 RepID=A0A951PF15_9CYAN|nr:DUF2256 domain-containing protein [Pegethrix bostrychoides GSE-TBD4-15B]
MPRSKSKSQAGSGGRVRSKSDLPTKLCPVCERPFSWRKKWENCWDEVKYCSERCRRHRADAASEPPA